MVAVPWRGEATPRRLASPLPECPTAGGRAISWPQSFPPENSWSTLDITIELALIIGFPVSFPELSRGHLVVPKRPIRRNFVPLPHYHFRQIRRIRA
jgi:hypothetical protein